MSAIAAVSCISRLFSLKISYTMSEQKNAKINWYIQVSNMCYFLYNLNGSRLRYRVIGISTYGKKEIW
jgi:hypothetical protein